ncbi:hypothetical protein U1Q18_043238 [Sarracenia purpurea var. burkii]
MDRKRRSKLEFKGIKSFTMDQAIGLSLLQEISIEYTKFTNISYNDDVWSLNVEDDNANMNIQKKEATNHIQTPIKVLMCKNIKHSSKIVEQDCSLDFDNSVLQKLCYKTILEAFAIIFDRAEIDETRLNRELKEVFHHNKMLNKDLVDKAAEPMVQTKLGMADVGMKEQETDSVISQNLNQKHNSFKSSPFFHCPVRFFPYFIASQFLL